MNKIPEQISISWGVAFNISWSSMHRQIFRSVITMSGIVLAIAFLSYMLSTQDITRALIEVNDQALNRLLQKNGIDIFSGSKTDVMTLMLIGLSLLTCLVGIINSMLMSVTERIKEIGTLKCLGALDSFIIKTYFIESTLQGVIGTAMGLVIGVMVSFIIALMAYKGWVLTCYPVWEVLKSMVYAMAIGSLISIVASIAPAYWAARKQPVEAMRVEE